MTSPHWAHSAWRPLCRLHLSETGAWLPLDPRSMMYEYWVSYLVDLCRSHNISLIHVEDYMAHQSVYAFHRFPSFIFGYDLRPRTTLKFECFWVVCCYKLNSLMLMKWRPLPLRVRVFSFLCELCPNLLKSCDHNRLESKFWLSMRCCVCIRAQSTLENCKFCYVIIF